MKLKASTELRALRRSIERVLESKDDKPRDDEDEKKDKPDREASFSMTVKGDFIDELPKVLDILRHAGEAGIEVTVKAKDKSGRSTEVKFDGDAGDRLKYFRHR